MKRCILNIGLILMAAAGPGFHSSALAAPDGAQLYGRCTACHLKNGAGVPGAFPPLLANVAALAEVTEGRRYLALVVTTGLFGPLVVGDRKYRGMMPAQNGMDDADVAAVLNYIVDRFAKSGEAPESFTAGEITILRKSGAGLRAQDVVRLRPKGEERGEEK